MWKDFQGTRHSLLSRLFFLSFAPPPSLYCDGYVCLYIHISDCVETVYELPLLLHNTTIPLTHFCTNREQWEVLSGTSCVCRASMTIKTLYYPTLHNTLFVDTIRIIIKNLKYSKSLQHVSDHKGSIIRELCTVHG